ncbi:MAG: pyroglutamyl-peptidase I [Serratia proteamaculans]|jgi:pyroglutamyl-peptidase|uniref:pyroglutamyl-peptidase I n=1 Tax=Serratia proteamaculans TaxID=28151 RepID=UPI000D951CE5|nr:pyroglutamyl-peptidase I [Serratia proteamaculans]SPZ56680.1 Pyrrolidone-carboxylate peptidase [Serratia quinivorans]NWA70678.1 pyroglutamyl-peptidase I [Serratia proteamaculans]CAI0859679.1 Pyrrolidone-carboxylate peptidase [Serratia proteamaculans]CAI0916637.1 Pyrrolidone-carboxylate peptidase [Serratia proteamaculans]CAI0921124.1 Pyrrolidone-carboxylate peptidase [Serratia proteamaculans]
MRKVLITGFEPFGGERVNPSWEVVKQLNDMELAGARIIARQLPCVFGTALEALNTAIDEVQPVMVLAIGQAGGRTDITLERVAINVDDARIPDNQGKQPIDEPIVESGPAAYFSTLPIKAMVGSMREAGIPASVSQTAGTYVCNHVMYGLLHRLSDQQAIKGGFIHIPYLPEQAAAHPGAPSMAATTVLFALELAISIALQVEYDLKVVGGATH